MSYKTADEIEALVASFEACAISKDGFSHRSHLAVATYYLHTSDPAVALEKMREGLLRFLRFHEIDLATYSEQVTRGWLKEIQKVMDACDTDASLVVMTNTVLERLSSFRLPVEADAENEVVSDS